MLTLTRRFAVVLGIVLGLALGCSRTPERGVPAPARGPLILLAVDGMEWSVATPLLNEGRLPNLASLMARGSFGYLATMTPTYSPVVWTTIATGKSPDAHGIKHFVYTDGGTTRYYSSGHRATKAVWNILSDYGLTVHVLGWWMTFPAEAINGLMVAQTNTTGVLEDPKRAMWKGSLLRGVEGQVSPPARQTEVMDVLDAAEAGFDSLTRSIFDGAVQAPKTPFTQLMWDQSRWAFRADAVYARMAERLLEEREPFDLLTFYLGGPDVASHRFWRYAHPKDFFHPPSPEETAAFGHVIDDYYVYLDRVLGDVLRLAPGNATVMIVSDHGFHTVNPKQEFKVEDSPENWNSGNHLDEPPGVFIAAGPMIRDAAPGDSLSLPLSTSALPKIGSVYDVLPTLLAIKDVPIGRDMRGQVLTEVVDAAWLERFPVRYVKTHDDKAFEAARRERMREAADQAERLEQLKSLGYIQ